MEGKSVRRGLHGKLTIIMILLIFSVMLVVSAFLVRGVKQFYLQSFYTQMKTVFENPTFISDLRNAAGQNDGPVYMSRILGAYSAELGIDTGVRCYYILSGETGKLLVSSESSEPEMLITPNVVTALTGREGSSGSIANDYMDIAVPIQSGDNSYIICVRDNRQTVTLLTQKVFSIILAALIIGMAISVLLSLLLSKTMVIPIQKLTKAAQGMTSGDFSDRIAVLADDEIGTLTKTFNSMAEQLHDTLIAIEGERNTLSTVFLYMTDGILVFSGEGKIIRYNPAAEKMLGIRFEDPEICFENTFGDIADFNSLLSMENDTVFEQEKNSDNRYLDIFFAPYPGDGKQRGVLAVVHDITEQRRSDEMRREFVANVSHELRTPITSVRSYAETISEFGSDMPEEQRKHFLGVILNESDRMTKIVQDLLSLSRFDAGETDLNLERFDLNESARNVFDALKLDAEKRGLKPETDLPDEPVYILGDKARIEQVIINICSNALRYTPAGGNVRLILTIDGSSARLSVADTGIGIPKADIGRIFDRFYRVDKARSRAMGGTGLGLSIAYEIVKRHNGRITVESEQNVGTTVTVILPIAEELP